MNNYFYSIIAAVVIWIFPAAIIFHALYLWGRGACFVMVFSNWLGGV